VLDRRRKPRRPNGPFPESRKMSLWTSTRKATRLSGVVPPTSSCSFETVPSSRPSRRWRARRFVYDAATRRIYTTAARAFVDVTRQIDPEPTTSASRASLPAPCPHIAFVPEWRRLYFAVPRDQDAARASRVRKWFLTPP